MEVYLVSPIRVMVVFDKHTDGSPSKISLLVCQHNVVTLQVNSQPRLRGYGYTGAPVNRAILKTP